MSEYNVIGKYYKTDTTTETFYPITRYDNVDTMGTYARRFPGGYNINGTIPFTQTDGLDTAPTWATAQTDGSVVINRAGYYMYNMFVYAPGEIQTFMFSIAIRCRKKNGNYDINLAENFAQSLDSGGVLMSTMGGVYYFEQGDAVRGTISITPEGGIHPNNKTALVLKPYQFETVQYWG